MRMMDKIFLEITSTASVIELSTNQGEHVNQIIQLLHFEGQ